MSQTLYIGGLAYATTDDGLRAYFEGAGTVNSASVITDRATGRSRGFGFVEMGSEEEANKAIEMLNGTELDGRMIRVNLARPKEEGGAGGARRSGGFNRGGFGGGARRSF